ncbi:hypothetical protein PIIN_11346 [Serendipita indica DSM 11827]|uniref:Uncharacterized protein n=1 Tax=Serendipita indica (strain DSM 11827) TaxID=1109443 RepID=G4U1C6_SERID|nr:hypothetical protein PIIN_11346 [Serendipita indica DSM 11827]
MADICLRVLTMLSSNTT